MIRLAALFCALMLATAPARAIPDPSQFQWRQNPGAQIPRDLALTGSDGNRFTLGAFLGKPVILDLGYYHCPGLCGLARADLYNALRNSGLQAGQDYRLLTLSIDPTETARDAAEARAVDLAQGAPPGDATALHYTVAAPQDAAALAQAAGFTSRFDSAHKQFLHPAGLAILTGSGRISSYLLGVGYQPGDVRAAVLRAQNGGIAGAALPVLLLCFHFDPTTGRYTLAIVKLLRLLALFTVATLAGLFLILRHQTIKSQSRSGQSA